MLFTFTNLKRSYTQSHKTPIYFKPNPKKKFKFCYYIIKPIKITFKKSSQGYKTKNFAKLNCH